MFRQIIGTSRKKNELTNTETGFYESVKMRNC